MATRTNKRTFFEHIYGLGNDVHCNFSGREGQYHTVAAVWPWLAPSTQVRAAEMYSDIDDRCQVSVD
jgi:hypothetical protein